MMYWRIQMNQPAGRGGVQINSLDLLNEPQPVIGSGEWDDIQCKYFKGEHKNGIKINDVILVHKGEKPIALCKVISDNFKSADLFKKFHHSNYRNVEVLDFYKGNFKFPAAQGTVERLINNTKSRRFIKNFHNSIIKKMNMDSIISILKHKKQIILQGPPGTGKTRLAKQLAEQLCDNNFGNKFSLKQINLSSTNIAERLKNVDSVQSATGRTKYQIENIKKDRLTVVLETNSKYEIPFKGIVDAYHNKLWEGGQSNGFDPYNAAIAKYLFENKSVIKELPKSNNNFALIQFHPSYTYEDFVRGITVKNNGVQIEYKTENKILGELAKKANLNFIDSKKESTVLSKEKWVNQNFEEFKESIIDSMEENEEFKLNNTVNIISVEEDAFRYTGNTWKNQFRMKYEDILFLYLNNVTTRQGIKKLNDINPLARTHATYFKLLLDKFYAYMKNKQLPKEAEKVVKEEKFVLIIDEINRANLPTVLGELIYALEYRGEIVKSMYDIDGNYDISLPPNLYIIGTMNTSDRSTGQIDYAIRRRFAFVDVLPKVLSYEELNSNTEENTPELFFAEETFKKVAELFVTNENLNDEILQESEHLSNEFKPENVWLGHSYFIHEKDKFNLKLKYEIKPLLREYVADGILIDSSTKSILKVIEELK